MKILAGLVIAGFITAIAGLAVVGRRMGHIHESMQDPRSQAVPDVTNTKPRLGIRLQAPRWPHWSWFVLAAMIMLLFWFGLGTLIGLIA